MVYMYALFIWIGADHMILQSFETMQECEIHKAEIQKKTGALGRCLWMEPQRV